MLAEKRLRLDAVIELKVDPDILVRRIENRVEQMKLRGEPLRADDNPEVLKQRLAAYEAQTAPLVTYYKGKGALRTVDGMASISDVAAAIGRALADAAFRPVAAAAKPLRRAARPSVRRQKRPRQGQGRVRQAGPAAKAKAAKTRQARAAACASPQAGRQSSLPPGRQNAEKKPEIRARAEVDEVRRNPLITGDPVGLSSNDAGPRVAGEGVALSLGRPLPPMGISGCRTGRNGRR